MKSSIPNLDWLSAVRHFHFSQITKKVSIFEQILNILLQISPFFESRSVNTSNKTIQIAEASTKSVNATLETIYQVMDRNLI